MGTLSHGPPRTTRKEVRKVLNQLVLRLSVRHWRLSFRFSFCKNRRVPFSGLQKFRVFFDCLLRTYIIQCTFFSLCIYTSKYARTKIYIGPLSMRHS